MPMTAHWLDELAYDENGLLPAVVQDSASGRVLMVGWVNREALQRTIESSFVHFWSRSRQKLWRKGETSGNSLRLLEAWRDCDDDTLLFKVEALGPTCHTGEESCFYRRLEGPDVG